MKLDRNNGRGKYAIINLRKLDAHEGDPRPTSDEVRAAVGVLENAGLIEYGEPGTENEFFVLMLKDKYAGGALYMYANEAAYDDGEYAGDVRRLSTRAGRNSPWCKKPD